MLTILLPFRRSNDKTFKHFYLTPVKTTLKYLFPHLVGVLKMCSTHPCSVFSYVLFDPRALRDL
ncbi:hypothetical protein PRO82_000655 [Candidatus Protochlamydia amoebophila]|nr:hypothetical protein [Candidatus Protochlamydia amoebophila]